VFGIDCAISRWQVSDMTIRSQHLEVISKIPVDGRRLGRRFYDQQFDSEILTKKRPVPLF
jgi:hypothetical protein